MAPKGGTFFFLLILACAARAETPDRTLGNKPDFKDMAKKLMKKCHDKGYPVPGVMLLKHVCNNSDLPMEARNADPSSTFLSSVLSVLDALSPVKDSLNRVPLEDLNKMENKTWNCSNLSTMIKLMQNSSEAYSCYMQAVVAPLSWETLNTQSERHMDSDDYDALLWAAKPVLQDMSSTRMNLPIKVEGQNVKKMMMMLQEVYNPMSEAKMTQVIKWAKEQITQNYFNCTMGPSSDSTSMLMERCKPSLKWLNTEALTMMGPYLSHLAPDDVDCSPKEKLCTFFSSAQFKSALSVATKMNPSLAMKFLQRFQECFSGTMEFAEHVDKLGTLACYYYSAPDLTANLSMILLTELNKCDDYNNPRIKMLKMRLVRSVTANFTAALSELGSSIVLLSLKELSTIPSNDLKKVLKNLGPTVRWTQCQLHTLVKKELGDKKCKEMAGEEVMALQSIAGGLPRCVLKNVKAQQILNDTEALKNISKQMMKGQLKAMLQGLLKDVGPSELVQKLQGALLCSVSLNNLDKANITSLNQVENKTWSLPQAAYLAKKMYDLKQLQYRKLRSVLQGITCKMIDKAADTDVQDMAQAMTEFPQWLSKVQAGCAAQKLFATLEKVRTGYFKTITGAEMDKIATLLLVHLPPSSVKDLPDSACPVFLYKMEVANLSSLPLLSPSRPALTQRALLCLANGTGLSGLTTEDVSRLGQLLCELQPSQLRLMAPGVLNFSLRTMASCQHIPQRHRADLIQLVNQTFGDPSNWSAETMEALGPLLLLDPAATSALPNKPWMKDVLYFLRSRLPQASDALKRKLFELTTTSNAARKKRTATSQVNNAKQPNVELIEELGMNNVYWTPAQLDQMSAQTFLATVEILGAVTDYNADQLAILHKKATESLGPVSQMTDDSVVVQMGCITRGFSNAELEKLPFSLDTLEAIAHCGWNESQMGSVWKGVAKYNNLTAQQLGATDMVALNQFICGLNASEIRQLNLNAFKDAVGSMDGVQCAFTVTQQLKSLAVSAFGKPSTWTEAQVSDMGNIIAGLNATELVSLDPSVFSFLRASCIPLIPPGNLAALSVTQLEALGPDNTAMVTNEQRAALRDKQLAALERAETGSRGQTQSPVQSGAPSLSVEGISAFMKPLLFLLMGFLLL